MTDNDTMKPVHPREHPAEFLDKARITRNLTRKGPDSRSSHDGFDVIRGGGPAPLM